VDALLGFELKFIEAFTGDMSHHFLAIVEGPIGLRIV
jgi:hypothetical protein